MNRLRVFRTRKENFILTLRSLSCYLAQQLRILHGAYRPLRLPYFLKLCLAKLALESASNVTFLHYFNLGKRALRQEEAMHYSGDASHASVGSACFFMTPCPFIF